jgi:hypothetical protein
MSGRDGDATKVLEVAKRFPENDTYVEVEAYRVPASDRYPEGIKYSMQYGTTDGKTVVRYDNFPDHPEAANHHKHTADGSVESIDFDGIRPLFERFKREVRNYGEHWP